MTCECKQDIEKRLLERFKGQEPDAKDHGVELSGYTFVIIGNKMESRGYMPIHVTAEHPLKKGGFKYKKQTQNMVFTYCPFCGVKYEAEA